MSVSSCTNHIDIPSNEQQVAPSSHSVEREHESTECEKMQCGTFPDFPHYLTCEQRKH